MQIAHYPKDCTEALASAMAIAGLSGLPLDDLAAAGHGSVADFSALIVELGEEPMRRLRHIETLVEASGIPVLVVVEAAHFQLVELAKGVADIITTPPDAAELGLRVRRLTKLGGDEDLVTFGDLELNPLTYQASLAGSPLDLTYMEYELLRFFVTQQGRVWSREQLLSKVWGYDYYGGARTVDVHVRRLRAKLGEERAQWITTVRSVGYRFG
jgi:DNA-binding response OmpR family regulator